MVAVELPEPFFQVAALFDAQILVQILFMGKAGMILDGAGTRTTSFNLIRFGASVAASLLLSLIVTEVLTPDDRK